MSDLIPGAITLLDGNGSQYVRANTAFDKLHKMLTRRLALTVTADVTLSADQALYGILDLSGSLVSPKTITIPAMDGKQYRVRNETGQTITIKYSGSTGVMIADGAAADIWCDDTEIYQDAAGGGSGDLVSTNNLSDVANAATARTNLGVPGLAANTFTNTQTIQTSDSEQLLSGGLADNSKFGSSSDEAGGFNARAGGGTRSSPSAVASGRRLGSLFGWGQYSTTVGESSAQSGVVMEAAENFSGTNRGARLIVEVTALAATTRTRIARFVSWGMKLGADSDPAASAVLDVESTTKGVLFPRMTTTQRDAISSPATGLIISNTTTSAVNVYSGAAWAAVGSSMATKNSYGSATAMTCTLTPSGTGLGNNAARESTVVDNTSTGAKDYQITLKTKLANSGSVSGAKEVAIYAYADADAGTGYTDGATGTDASFTMPTTPNLAFVGAVKFDAINTSRTSQAFSLAAAFGGVIPAKWGIVVHNNTGTSLSNTSGDHVLTYRAVTEVAV